MDRGSLTVHQIDDAGLLHSLSLTVHGVHRADRQQHAVQCYFHLENTISHGFSGLPSQHLGDCHAAQLVQIQIIAENHRVGLICQHGAGGIHRIISGYRSGNFRTADSADAEVNRIILANHRSGDQLLNEIGFAAVAVCDDILKLCALTGLQYKDSRSIQGSGIHHNTVLQHVIAGTGFK